MGVSIGGVGGVAMINLRQEWNGGRTLNVERLKLAEKRGAERRGTTNGTNGHEWERTLNVERLN